MVRTCLGVFALALLQGASFHQALLRWYLFGIGQFLLGASWVFVSINTHGGASVLVAAGLTGAFIAAISLVTLAQGYVYQRFFSHLQLLWIPAFAGLWFFKEWSTTWLLWAGFPWALLGYGHIHSPFAGYAPLIGVLGVGFVVALCAALLFAAVTNLGRHRLVWLLSASGLIGSGLLLGLLNFTQPISEPLKVSLVQGNVAQQTKWRRDMVEPIIRQYVGLTEAEWGRDLVVWPEAALTLFADSAGSVLQPLDVRGDYSGTALLLGLPRRQEAGPITTLLW